jgi:hypothetical protein
MAKATMRTGGASTGEYEPLPEDIYVMRIKEADITLSSFKDEKTGEDQWQLALTWEVSRLTEEQKEAEVDDSRWVRQWFSLFYGETKKGPSKLKVFIDSLRSQGLLEDFDPEEGEIDSDWFEGIEQRVTVGVNAKGYNTVVMISPLRKKGPAASKNAPQRIEQAPVKASKPAKTAPKVAVVEPDEDEGELFDEDIPF